jgi:hypothetical protein
MSRLWVAVTGVALLATSVRPLSAQPLDLRGYEIVDLTHPLNEKTLFWPTSPSGFKLDRLSHGVVPGGWFYAANSFCTPEHGGTHLEEAARPDRRRRHRSAAHRMGEALAGSESVLRRRHAQRRLQAPLPELRRGSGATPGRGAPRRRDRSGHAFDRLRTVEGLHRPPHRRGAKRRGPREPARPLRAAADRRHGVRAAHQDRRRLGRTGASDRAGASEALNAAPLIAGTSRSPCLERTRPSGSR